MMIDPIGSMANGAGSTGAMLALVAFAIIAGGLLISAKGLSFCDGIARVLLNEDREEGGQRQSLNGLPDSFRRERIRAWVVGATILGGVAAFPLNCGLGQSAIYLGLGCVSGELFQRGASERKIKRLVREQEFFLPNAMERVVMAVSSGLDIIPALSEAARGCDDPVSDIFRRIVSASEGGLRVEHAIRITADSVRSLPTRHALAHLTLAYKQGGEIVRPLKELSDATQTHYQENVEEEIAKLPVRAVLPLLLTFTGLIICFLTVPVVQVGASLEKFEHATK